MNHSKRKIQQLFNILHKHGCSYSQMIHIIYLADRLHMRVHHRSITRSDYNIINDTVQPVLFDLEQLLSNYNDFEVKWFSGTDMECLNLVIEAIEDLSILELSQMLKLYPDYFNNVDNIEFDMNEFFSSYENSQLKIFNQSDELLQICKEFYIDNEKIKKILND